MLVKHLDGILAIVDVDYPVPVIKRLPKKQIANFDDEYFSNLEISWELDDISGEYVYLTISDMKNHINVCFDSYLNHEHNVEMLEIDNLNYCRLCDVSNKLQKLLSILFRKKLINTGV
jgi:hypothetical protein